MAYSRKGKISIPQGQKKTRIFVFLCAVKVNSNHGIRLSILK